MMKGLIANDEYAVCLLNAKSFVFEQYVYIYIFIHFIHFPP